jgi:thiol-disulfide isomerase/thioredoxin
MRNTLVGLLVLLVVPALWASDDKAKPKDQPATPADQFRALAKEYSQAQNDYILFRAKGINIDRPNAAKYAGRILELAKQYPKDAASIEALLWVMRFEEAPKEAEDAWDILLRDHVADPGMGVICGRVGNTRSPKWEKLVRAVLDKNPHRDDQGAACCLLAFHLDRQARLATRTSRTADAENLRHEAEQLFHRVARSYADVDDVRRQVLWPNTGAAPKLIRTVLEKTTDRDLKGRGSYALAMRLKQDAERAVNADQPAAAEALNREAEQFLELVSKDYADVAHNFRKLGDLAKGELFELRHLAIGKQVPEIEAEDLDGKRLKLSDFRGKVVLLDFWGNWSPPCRAMYPYERSLVKKLADKPFALVGVNSDPDRDKLKEVLTKEQITWRSFWNGPDGWIGPEGNGGPISGQWNVRRWPTLYVIDAKGIIRHKHLGRPGDDVLDKEIEKLVAQAEKTGADRP